MGEIHSNHIFHLALRIENISDFEMRSIQKILSGILHSSFHTKPMKSQCAPLHIQLTSVPTGCASRARSSRVASGHRIGNQRPIQKVAGKYRHSGQQDKDDKSPETPRRGMTGPPARPLAWGDATGSSGTADMEVSSYWGLSGGSPKDTSAQEL